MTYNANKDSTKLWDVEGAKNVTSIAYSNNECHSNAMQVLCHETSTHVRPSLPEISDFDLYMESL